MGDEERTTGMGLWTDANQMLAAAKHLASVESMSLVQPLYYLLGHAIELAFKSYVRARGASLGCLKSIGHDLDLARERAQTAGLGDLVKLSPNDQATISLLNVYYKAKEFEYRVTGSKKYPHVEDLVALLERILSATKHTCAARVAEPDA